jgi:hypothetical protein
MAENPVKQEQVVYQAEPGFVQTLQSIRINIHGLCGMYKSRMVRVQTVDGMTHEGIIVHVDARHLYLSVSQMGHQRAFGYPYGGGYYYNNVILPLVLYELLLITLL